MMALRAHARGGPEELRYERAPVPVAGPGEALIEVHAAGVTFAELTWDESWTTSDGRDRTPVVPAHEVSGIVAGVGAGASNLAAGDEVLGLIDFNRDGAAAEYVAAPVANLANKPPSVSHAEAATLGLAGLTAWQALVDHAGLERGEQVLVQGGAGGVGNFVVQLAAALGADVTATGRPRDIDLVRSLGAKEFWSPDDLPRQSQGEFDVVIDTVGGTALEESYDLVREGGRLVTLSAPPDQEKAARRKIHAMFFIVAADPGELAGLAERVAARTLRPLISQEFPLADGRQAYESGRHPRPPGKTILVVR